MNASQIIAPYFYDDEFDGTQALVRSAGQPLAHDNTREPSYLCIVMEMDRSYIELSVDPETDEIICKLVKSRAWDKPSKYEDIGEFAPFEGRGLTWMWTGVSWRGYSDAAMFSFDGIIPDVVIIAAAGTLTILMTQRLCSDVAT